MSWMSAQGGAPRLRGQDLFCPDRNLKGGLSSRLIQFAAEQLNSLIGFRAAYAAQEQHRPQHSEHELDAEFVGERGRLLNENFPEDRGEAGR